jgi:hypothetical protein
MMHRYHPSSKPDNATPQGCILSQLSCASLEALGWTEDCGMIRNAHLLSLDQATIFKPAVSIERSACCWRQYCNADKDLIHAVEM